METYSFLSGLFLGSFFSIFIYYLFLISRNTNRHYAREKAQEIDHLVEEFQNVFRQIKQERNQ